MCIQCPLAKYLLNLLPSMRHDPGIYDQVERIASVIEKQLDEWPTRLYHLATSKLHDRHKQRLQVAQDIMISLAVPDAKGVGDKTTLEDKIMHEFTNTARYAVLSPRSMGQTRLSSSIPLNKGACGEARKHGCQYVWFDTGCIEPNPVEVQETVRSLHRWFANAYICLVYGETDPHAHGLYGDEFFKRGWALQELLAPRRLKFYNQKWDPLTNDDYDIDRTTKRYNFALVKRISELSGIDEDDLLEFRRDSPDIRRILTWVSNKTEARPEDLVYCLLGFFDRIHIDISYTKGLETAFHELQIALLKSYDDRGLFVFYEPYPSRIGMLAIGPWAFKGPLKGFEPSFDLFVRNASPDPVTISSVGHHLRVPVILLAATQSRATSNSPFVEVEKLGHLNCTSIQEPTAGSLFFAILGLRNPGEGQLVFGVLLQREPGGGYQRICTDPSVLECAAPDISSLRPQTVSIEIRRRS